MRPARPTHRPRRLPRTGAQLQLLAQQFAIEADGTIRLGYRLTGLTGDQLELAPDPAPPDTAPADTTRDTAPADTAPADTAPGAVIEGTPTTLPAVVPDPPVELTILVTNYRPVTDPDDLAELVGSDVDPDAFSAAVDGVAITDLRSRATLADDGSVEFTLDIGTDTLASVQDRLKFDQPGLYPLRVQLLLGDPADGNVLATAGTVVQRLPGPLDDSDTPPPVDLSVVTVTPSPGPAAPTADIVAARTALDAAIDLAATIDVPVTLEVPPQLVADEAATEEGAQRLSDSLENDELVALPIIPLDVSSAVAANRPDAFTRLVIAGEDLLTEAVPTTPTGRDVWITSDPLSAGGAQQLRDLGVRYVIMPSELYRDTVSTTLPATDLFVEAALPDGGTLPILVVDPLAVELTPSAADDILERATPTEWAVETVAGILLEQNADDADEPPGRAPERSRILTTPDLLAPDARLLGGLEALVATTPSVRFALASSLIGVTDVQETDGEPLVVELPEVAGPSLTRRIEVIDCDDAGDGQCGIDAACRRRSARCVDQRTRCLDLHGLQRRRRRSGHGRPARRGGGDQGVGRPARTLHLHPDRAHRLDRPRHRQHQRRAPDRQRRSRVHEGRVPRGIPDRDVAAERRDHPDHSGGGPLQRNVVHRRDRHHTRQVNRSEIP